MGFVAVHRVEGGGSWGGNCASHGELNGGGCASRGGGGGWGGNCASHGAGGWLGMVPVCAALAWYRVITGLLTVMADGTREPTVVGNRHIIAEIT